MPMEGAVCISSTDSQSPGQGTGIPRTIAGIFIDKKMELRELAFPEFCGTQSAPPFIVFRIIPLLPAIYPMFASVK